MESKANNLPLQEAGQVTPKHTSYSYPLSPAQRRVWFLEQLHSGLAVYTEAEAVRLVGELNIEFMERALNVIVSRHEALRTTIEVTGSQPMAVVHESWPIRLKRIDLSVLADLDRRAEVDRLLVDEPKELFHLESEPGIRATLLCLGAQDHIFILMTHHMFSDWASEGILWRELAGLYRSYLRGEPPTLPALTVQHKDYVVSRLEKATEDNFAKDLAFWEENLREAPRLLDLPADRTRPPKPSYQGARQRLFLNPVLTQRLRDLSKRTGATLFTVFAAALDVLFSRYTGKEDIVLGIPVTDRDRKELCSIFGFLLHTHVLRTELSASMTFRNLLSMVQKRILKLHIHRAVPFEHVVRRLQPERDLSYSPLFQVMLSWRDRENLPSSIGLDGIVATPEFAHSGTSKFDLTLLVTDCGDEIWLEMEYSTDLFDEARIARMLGHYQTLLDSAALNPDQRLVELPLLTPAEREQLLTEWNQTEAAWPHDRRLCELIEDQVKRTPDSVAASFGDRQLTYRELNERANQLAFHLQSLGIGPNTLVGICVQRSLEMLVGLVGVLKAGGAYVPLDPAYPSDRLAFMLEDCRPTVLLTQKKLHSQLPPNRAYVVSLDVPFGAKTWEGEQRSLQDKCGPRDLAYVIYTSGSTGKPKGVKVSNRALVNFLTAMQREPGLSPQDTLLAVTTLSFDIAGLEMFLPLITGGHVVIADKGDTLDGARLAALIKRCGATVMQATPATWRLLLGAGWTGSHELKILCGGEAWPQELADELSTRSESLWNMYGPTETTIWSAVSRAAKGQSVLIGRPISNTTFYVLDSCQGLVPIGVPGELYIGGDGVAEGYLNRPDLTEDRFIADPFRPTPGARLYKTGDLVRRLSDGTIEFLRRIDQQVKIRGFRIELEEVEAVLKQHPGVAQCVALAREDHPGDKRLVAYLVLVDPSGGLRTKELRSFLKQKLPDYMIPTLFVALDRLPLTPNGKINRKALPAPGQPCAGQESERESLPPRTSIEIEIARIWEQVLGIKPTNVRDSFFDFGGHSLLAVQMFAQIENVFGCRLPLTTLYEAPSIDDLARILQGELAAPGWSSLVRIQPSGSRPPFFCFHGAGGNVLIYRKLSQYLGSDQPFYGLQSQGLDGQSPIPESIEKMAALYVKEIRAVQPHGPYLLGGYCLGGSIAYEAAQQLHAAGEDVALLALFDTLNWHKVPLSDWNKFSLYFQRLVFHAAVLFQLDFEGKRKFLGEKIREMRHRVYVWREMLLTKLRGKRPAQDTSDSLVLGRVWLSNHLASQRYVPLPYQGAVTEFRPARQYQVLSKPGLNWEGLALGGQKVVVIPTYPAMMLVEPFVRDLAVALSKSIDDAICPETSCRHEKGFAADVLSSQPQIAIRRMIADGIK